MSLQDSINSLHSKYDDLNQRLMAIENQDAQPNTFTKLEFQNRFTWEESIELKKLEETDYGAQVLRDKQKDAKWIDVEDPGTVLGMMYLNAKLPLVFTPERVAELLLPRQYASPEMPVEPETPEET